MDNVEKPGAAKIAPVLGSIDCLDEKLNILGQLILELEKKLEPVVSKRCETEPPKPERATASCPIEERIVEATERLESYIDNLRDIQSRIKV